MTSRPAPADRDKGSAKRIVAKQNKVNKIVQSGTQKASAMGARPSAVKKFLKKYSQGMQ
ncbi:hypothetical protein UFOVP929_35 [uncultured Caudovirales phage]|uniref:Uncharacterized protein n=1 Tax=uncultured Caudovirales phage TaxID=2100421 RepID=A0A6J5PJL6_9CAUD|nr:hypothetical protein UFOVP929_35 [uncultured Caudovirales phage]